MQKGPLVGKVWKLVLKLVRTSSRFVCAQSTGRDLGLGMWNPFPHLSLAWWDFLCLSYFRFIIKIPKITVLLLLAELRTGLEVLWKDWILGAVY